MSFSEKPPVDEIPFDEGPAAPLASPIFLAKA
jgi:hypothetical protein